MNKSPRPNASLTQIQKMIAPAPTAHSTVSASMAKRARTDDSSLRVRHPVYSKSLKCKTNHTKKKIEPCPLNSK